MFSKQKKSNTIKITNSELATNRNIFFLICPLRFQTEFSFQFVCHEYSDTFEGFRKLYCRVPFVRKTHLVLSRQATRKKRALHYETKMAASETPLGFHMTSPKFKFSILLSFYFCCQSSLNPIFAKFFFERVLGFLTESAWISNHLRDTYVTARDT